MVENTKPMTLVEKLSKIRAIADVVAKSRKGFNYSYSDITEILAKVTAGMNRYNVSLIPHIVPGTSSISQNVVYNTKADKTGRVFENKTTEMLYQAEMVFSWVNNDDTSDRLDVPWYVTGSQSDPSQAFGAGLTYCTRYFLTSFFQIAQPDTDADAYRSKQKAAEESEDRAVAEGIIGELDTLIRSYLADHAEKAEEVKKFIARYVKGSNYQSIKEPVLAAKLLNDFRTKYYTSEGMVEE